MLLEQINKLRKVADYINNIQNHLLFCSLTTNYVERKLKKQSHLQQHQRMKYLGINLTKEVKDSYTENYKILMKEIKHK